MKDMKVSAAFEEMEGPQKRIALELRKVINAALPGAIEELKWGAPTYSVNGRLVVAISAYNDHVNLQFYKGAMLDSKFLEGTGKGLRHIKVYAISDIKKTEFTKLLKEASKL